MDMEYAQSLFRDLLNIIRTLRGPNGCPWDRKQTHRTLIPYMLEEAHEAVAAIEENNMTSLAEELGDVLLQVVLHAEIASERLALGRKDAFDISIVLNAICSKLRYRHPHVFDDLKVETSQEVVENWNRLKLQEHKNDSSGSTLDSVSSALPQLTAAWKYQVRAAQTGFDWDNIADVLYKVEEELHELVYEIKRKAEKERIEDEAGDLLFAIVNLCRFLDVNPEEALRKANKKFKRRFTCLEKRLGGAENMKTMSVEELDLEWDKVKLDEKA
ncbi:MAG: nucleoside triphosphate pyrophosphohydrolase [bacterium]